jgi:hypothetical protein
MERKAVYTKRLNILSVTKEDIVFIICLICLALFAISAYAKIGDHERFAKGLLKVKYIGEYAVFISWSVPITEIIVCVFLIIPPTHRIGLWGFTGLMTVFTLYIASMLLRAEKLPCYCNLIIEKLSWSQHLCFNITFIALAAAALWLGTKTTNS